MSKKNRGFTLIELLIVTVVIVTLMGVVFRLAGAGGDTRAKSKTVARLQRIENALSGYYAAYGSYPPVPLQGRSRDINIRVDDNGLQGDRRNTVNLSSPNNDTRKQVEAACRAQPVAVLFPFYMLDGNDKLKKHAETVIRAINAEKGGKFKDPKNLNKGNIGKSSWQDVQYFQFGLLSFLLPRYLFMMKGVQEMYTTRGGQWWVNNQRPCRLDTGVPYESWKTLQEYLGYQNSSGYNRNSAIISNMTSQAVCARWMPNFEGIISGGRVFFGVDTSDDEWPYLNGNFYDALPGYRKCLHRFSGGGYESSVEPYLLDGMTIEDGWGTEFYYYSDPPYQNYDLWSAGPNRYTFPPWLSESEFSQSEQKTILNWKGDDVRHLAN